MPPETTEAELETLAARAGLRLPAERREELRAAWGKLQAVLARLREPPIPAEAEPATTFRAGGRP